MVRSKTLTHPPCNRLFASLFSSTDQADICLDLQYLQFWVTRNIFVLKFNMRLAHFKLLAQSCDTQTRRFGLYARHVMAFNTANFLKASCQFTVLIFDACQFSSPPFVFSKNLGFRNEENVVYEAELRWLIVGLLPLRLTRKSGTRT